MMTSSQPALSLTHTLHEKPHIFEYISIHNSQRQAYEDGLRFHCGDVRYVLTAFFICYCSLLSVPLFRLMNYVSSNCILYEDTTVQNLASTIFRGVKI
jgi:hypothetical protein